MSQPDVSLPAIFPITDSHPDAKLVLSQVEHPSNSIFLLTLSSPPENRLTPSFIESYLEALDFVERRLPSKAVLVTTSAYPKFYSNGFNIELILQNGKEEAMKKWFYKLMLRFLTFPRPTVALLNGHCFAAGFMTAMAHDYRVMNPNRGWVCMNEVDLGLELAPGMTSIFREKVSPTVFRSIILEGHRFTGPEALKAGIVDATGDLKDAIKLIEEHKLIGKGMTNVYGGLRDEMWRETIRLFERYPGLPGKQRDEAQSQLRPRWSKL